jgi:ADP-ribosylglycohydrolase
MGTATRRDFAEMIRLVIDLGGDTDTVAAVAGGLAGAVFGMGGIPLRTRPCTAEDQQRWTGSRCSTTPPE